MSTLPLDLQVLNAIAALFLLLAFAMLSQRRVVTLVMNPALESRVPIASRARIDSLQSRMLAGDYSVATSADTISRR